MIYEEVSLNKKIAIISLIVAFIALFEPWNLGIRELLSEEGKYAAIALSMHFDSLFSVFQGDYIAHHYPLFPWFTMIAYKLGFSKEMGIRLVSIISLAGLSVLIYTTARKMLSVQEAAISVAVLMSSVVTLTKAIDGVPFVMSVLIVYLGWLLWYTHGVVRSNWNKAWIISSIFCGLSFYTLGWLGVFCFFVPLFFMRRPMTIWRKINNYGFKVAVAIVAVFILIWIIPRIQMINQSPFISSNVSNLGFFDYLKGVVEYPFETIWIVMPWTLIAWPAFCVGYYPLDRNPIFSRFLRTIVLSLFIIMMFSPVKDSRTAIILLPALSLMIANNYRIVTRRNGYALKLIMIVINIVLFIGVAISFLLYLLPSKIWSYSFFNYMHYSFLPNGIEFFKEFHYLGLIQCFAGVVIAGLLFIFREKIPIWFYMLFLMVVFMTIFWSITIPYRSQDNEARVTATKIIKDIGNAYSKDLVIYKGPDIADIYVLGDYLGCKIKQVQDFSELPNTEKSVYLLTLATPMDPDRQWSIVSSPIYKGKTIILWQGVKYPKKTILGI